MDLPEFLGPDTPVLDLKATDRWAAIDELITDLVATNRLPSAHEPGVRALVRARESTMSTGIGHGLAIPHAASELVQDLVFAIGRSRGGIDFESIDQKPVFLVFLFVVPKGEFQKHLSTLANIAKLVRQRQFRDGLWDRFM